MASDDMRIEHHFSQRYMAAVKRFGMKRNEEMIELLVEQNEQLEQKNAAMRKLLEAVIDTSKTGIDDDPGYTSGDPEESQCFFCGGEQDTSYKPPEANRWRKEYHHEPECAWLKARAFLAAHPKQD